MAALLDLQMLTQTDGGRHGLHRTRVVPGPTHSLIEATGA